MTECQCVGARAWRTLRKSARLGEVLAELLGPPEIRDLNAVVHCVPHSARRGPEYDQPPLSPVQIRMRAEASWAAVEARIAASGDMGAGAA